MLGGLRVSLGSLNDGGVDANDFADMRNFLS